MNVPKLRFKEFSDEWQVMKISNISSGITKGTTPKKYSDSGINFIKVENIHDNTITNINSYISTNTHNGKLKRSILKENDILFSIAGALGRTAIVKKDILPANTNQACSIIRLDNPDEINLNYLINRLNNTDIKNYIFKCQSVGAQPNLSLEQVNNILISYPSKTEQRKIGKLLSIIDKKIELQSKKIEALKLFKLYIRNKLLLDAQNKKIKLRDLVKCDSSTITLSDIENDFGPYPIYGATGLIKRIEKYNYENEYIAIIKDGAGVGKTILCNSKSSIIATMNALISINEYPINYIYEHINKIKFEKYIVGSGIPHIYFKDYGNEEFYIHNLEEANKIDIIFKCLDKKIELLSSKLNKLNKLKKGLMQNMFV